MNRMQEGVESAASPDGVPRAPAAARRMPRPSILGVEFDFTDYAGVLAAIRLWRDAGRRESGAGRPETRTAAKGLEWATLLQIPTRCQAVDQDKLRCCDNSRCIASR